MEHSTLAEAGTDSTALQERPTTGCGCVQKDIKRKGVFKAFVSSLIRATRSIRRVFVPTSTTLTAGMATFLSARTIP